jgi:hypothetical protein
MAPTQFIGKVSPVTIFTLMATTAPLLNRLDCTFWETKMPLLAEWRHVTQQYHLAKDIAEKAALAKRLLYLQSLMRKV